MQKGFCWLTEHETLITKMFLVALVLFCVPPVQTDAKRIYGLSALGIINQRLAGVFPSIKMSVAAHSMARSSWQMR